MSAAFRRSAACCNPSELLATAVAASTGGCGKKLTSEGSEGHGRIKKGVASVCVRFVSRRRIGSCWSGLRSVMQRGEGGQVDEEPATVLAEHVESDKRRYNAAYSHRLHGRGGLSRSIQSYLVHCGNSFLLCKLKAVHACVLSMTRGV